jgi:hypothetical protein
MQRARLLFQKFLRKSWYLLSAIVVALLKDRIISGMNRFLNVRSGPIAETAALVLRWLCDTPLGIVGVFTLLVTTGLLAYSFFDAYHNFPKTKPKSAGKPGRGAKPIQETFFQRHIYPPLTAAAILIAVAGISASIFRNNRAYLNISNQQPPIVSNPNYLVAQIRVTNPTEFPARKFGVLGNIIPEPDASDKSEEDAIGIFESSVLTIKQKDPNPELPTIGPHQSTDEIISGAFIFPSKAFRPLANAEDLLAGDQTLFLLALARWFDDAGYHERHFCQKIKVMKAGRAPSRGICKGYGDEF